MPAPREGFSCARLPPVMFTTKNFTHLRCFPCSFFRRNHRDHAQVAASMGPSFFNDGRGHAQRLNLHMADSDGLGVAEYERIDMRQS